MAIDVSTDHLIFDNTESVTVTLKRAGGESVVQIDNALEQQVDRREVEAAGVRITGKVKSWSIAKAEMGSKEFMEGDTVKNSDGVWTVKSVNLKTWNSSWVVVCQKERT